MYRNTTGQNNTALGHSALKANTTATGNFAAGYYALEANTTGHSNAASGTYALSKVTDGDYNTGHGFEAGSQITTGSANVCLGKGAGDVITTGSNNITIGYLTDTSAVGSTNQLVIGNSITGGEDNQVTIGKASNVIQCEFDTDATWTRSSDVRKKKNIENSTLGLDFIKDLRPVTFEWKPSYEMPKDFVEYNEENQMTLDYTMHGLIAQEVKESLDKQGVDNFGGWKEDKDGSQKVAQDMFIYPLIKSIQELSTKLDAALARIATLEG
jgi:hypothetical protein